MNEYDIGSYRLGIKFIEQKFKAKFYDIFEFLFIINAGVFGPIFETNTNDHWLNPYLHKLKDPKTAICSPVINFLKHSDSGGPGPRCQTYCSLIKINKKIYNLLLNTKIKNWSENTDNKSVPYKEDCIFKKHINHHNTILIGEYGVTRILLNNGYKISCLIYDNVNYNNKNIYDNYSNRIDRADEYKEEYFHKCVFIKNNWIINSQLRDSLPVFYEKCMQYYNDTLKICPLEFDCEYAYDDLQIEPFIQVMQYPKIDHKAYKCDCSKLTPISNCPFNNRTPKTIANTKKASYNLFGKSEQIVLWPKRHTDNNCVAIYCHYDRDNIVRDYVLQTLKTPIVLRYDIIFCTSSKSIDNVDLPFVINNFYIEKSYSGSDFVMIDNILQTRNLEKYQWIQIINDSILLPVHGIQNMKKTIETYRKDNDIWGLYLSNENKIHLCSCHFEFKAKCLESISNFIHKQLDYCSKTVDARNHTKFLKQAIVDNIEVCLIEHLHSLGFIYDGVVRYDALSQDLKCIMFNSNNIYKYIQDEAVFGIKWKYICNYIDYTLLNNHKLNFLLRFIYMNEQIQDIPMHFGPYHPSLEICLVAMFKNESHIIREWMNHYVNEGINHFFLIDNGSTDDYRSELQSITKDIYTKCSNIFVQ